MVKFKLVRRGDSWKMEAAGTAPRDYEEDEKYAAEALLMLANGGAGVFTLSPSATTTCEKHQDESSTTSASTPARKRSHACNVCGKTFRSYQALGGHRTSHRPTSSASNAAPCGSRLHECTICHQIFPSGQALGGHMSKHFEGRKSAGAASKRRRVTSSDGCPADHVVPVLIVRDFDLNEMPAPELF